MSKHLFTRLTLGYAGEKTLGTLQGYQLYLTRCLLPGCINYPSRYKGVGSRLCEHHQSLMREYGGPGRIDRPYTFNKKRKCDICKQSPWDHIMIKKITDPLIRDRVAWGMLIVDHIHTRRDGGDDNPENCQTLCMDCNHIKTTLACDNMPKSLYSNENDYDKITERLYPYYKKLFGNKKQK